MRERDADRFLAGLFAAPERRPLLYTIYAFDLEVAAIGGRAGEPMAGEIRLQWWREAVSGERAEEAAASPVAAALLATIDAAELGRDPFISVLDARGMELRREPIATIAEFGHHADCVAGGVMRAAAAALEYRDSAPFDALVHHASWARAAVEHLRQFAFHAARDGVRLPEEILARHGVARDQMRAQQDTPALRSALAEFRALARSHAEAAMALRVNAAPASAWPAFLPVALTALYLDRMDAADYRPFATAIDVAQWRRQWRLWRFARSIGKTP